MRSDSRLLLWVAQGFGTGRVPIAPGTFGSVVGLFWFALLLMTGSLWTLIGGIVLGIAASVWLCDFAERNLQQKDPASVVLDEITAMPICFLSWLGVVLSRTGTLPTVSYFLSGQRWLGTLGVFVAFRFFDVVKPWPVRQSQSLPGGWGITIDDVLAAVYVNLLVVLVEIGKAKLTT